MKVGETTVIIGKRIPIGAAIGSLATMFSYLHPQYASAIIAAAVPLTFIAQVIIVNFLGVTSDA